MRPDGRARLSGGVPTAALSGGLAGAALLLALASAFAQGGETLVGQGLVIAAGALGIGALALASAGPWPPSLCWAAVCWGGLVAWCLVQAAPLGLGAHPAWPAAATILGEPLAGAIALDPQAAADAGIRLAAYAGLFAAGLAAARLDAGLLAGLAVGVAAIAAIALFVVDWDIGAAGLAKVRHSGDLAFPFASRNQFCVFAGLGAIAAIAILAAPGLSRPWLRLLLAAALLVSLAAAFATHSRAGLTVVAAGSLAAAIPILRPRRGVVIAVALLATLVALAFAAGTLARLESLGEAGRLRLDIIVRAFALALERPWLGAGSFDLAFQAAAPAYSQGLVQSAHTILAESLVERGWPATGLAFLAIAVTVGQCARSIAAGGGSRVRGTAAIGVATMVLLHGMVDFSLHAPTIAALVAFVWGLGAAPVRQPAPAPPLTVARSLPLEEARA